MPTLVRVTINDSQIESLFLPGGDGWGWMRKVGREQLYETIGNAPKRTGELAASFRLSLTPNGRSQVRYTVGSYSDHAEYVVFGTGTPIWADGRFVAETKGGYALLWMRGQPHGWFPNGRWVRFVRGQEANNFMGRAADVVLSRYAL